MTEANKQSLIRPATLADIPAMLELDRLSPTAAHWTERQYGDALQSAEGNTQRLIIIAESDPDKVISAFLIAHHISPEWELENIVVAQSARRQGLATQLLDALLTRARDTNSESIFLEVRESNTAARTLYERSGFQQTGGRKAYYANPLEDAILYRLHLK
jgi:[ribosomal protein S18]-alanine N-acetyltransferase